MELFDVVIIGTGAAGLFCALQLPTNWNILIITKKKVRDCNSYLAQGGITIVQPGDEDAFFEDTMKAGQYQNDPHIIRLLAKQSPFVLSELQRLQVPFTTKNGTIYFTKEGAHQKRRIAYAKDETGKYIMESLLKAVTQQTHITLWENTTLIDILETNDTHNRHCQGVLVERRSQQQHIFCNATVLACGGIGGLFQYSTNQPTVTGDALAIAHCHHVTLRQLTAVQFHPTCFYPKLFSEQRKFLISETVRGEGGLLLNQERQRFVDELLPRDVVTAAIRKELQKTPETPYVWLDISHQERYFITTRFPNIFQTCLALGYDMTSHPLPVTPAQHYHMGGIAVDADGCTSLPQLYAIGEVSCTDLHGANRLASNSLLEALVFAKQAALHIQKKGVENPFTTDRDFYLHPILQNKSAREQLVCTLLKKENGGLKHELFYDGWIDTKSI